MAEMRLQQRQTAQLSAQQVMTSQLLQLPLTQLEQRIYDEVQDNPMLELVERRPDDGLTTAASSASTDSTEMFDSVARFERSSMKSSGDGAAGQAANDLASNAVRHASLCWRQAAASAGSGAVAAATNES